MKLDVSSLLLLLLLANHQHNKPMIERPLWEREVVGSNPGDAIPKALKMVPVATLLGAQHYKASTGSPLTNY